MKPIFISLTILCLGFSTLKGQLIYGEVGIGTSGPLHRLHVKSRLDTTVYVENAGNLFIQGTNHSSNHRIGILNHITKTTSGYRTGLKTLLQFQATTPARETYTGHEIEIDPPTYFPPLNVSNDANLFGLKVNIPILSTTGNHYGVYVDAQSSQGYAGYFLGRGHFSNHVGIKTVPRTDYALTVNGDILCEKVRVEMSEDWPDYVFEPDCHLKDLHRLKKDIRELGHLPGMPSADVVAEEGIDVGEMQRLLLEKVEELTLYIIELNEKNDNLRKEIEKLKN